MMKSKVVSILLAATITLLPVISVSAQQGSLTPEETQIKQYREEIGRLSSMTPPPEAQASHRNALLSLRKKLLRLLLEKRGALKKDIRDLQSSTASAEYQEYVRQLGKTLQGVDGEIQGLDREVEQGGSVAMTANAPIPAMSPAPEASSPPPPPPTERQVSEKKAFDATVSNITAEDLKDAAAPPEVAASKLPAPGCDVNGDAVGATASKFEQAICGLAGEINDRKSSKIILLSGDKGTLLPILIAKLLKTNGSESFVSFITEAQEARTDQQIGAGPGNAGTTSLVVKGGVPSALGFAVENGAAIESRSDTTVTFRINPAGALNLFANKGFITGFRQDENDPVMKFLRKSSIGLTFDTSRGSEPGVFTGTKQQLSAFSYRVEFFNERDPRNKKYEKEWEAFVADKGIELAKQIYATTLALNDFGTAATAESFKDPALQAWLNQTNERIVKVDTSLGEAERINALANIIREQADLLPVKLVTEQTTDAITNFAKAFKAYTDEKNKLLDRIAKGKIFTFEYTNKREVSAPDTSNLNFIYGTGTGRRIDLTANGALTFFNKRPAAASLTAPRPNMIRDFQFAGQVDVPFGNVKETGQFVFWFSGRYERLMENASTQAGTMIPNTKGDIAVGQFGLKIPIKGLGMVFPISVTFSNRTELIKEKEIRGNFGFTFNLDTLLSKFKPF
jgi:hypothetical protein